MPGVMSIPSAEKSFLDLDPHDPETLEQRDLAALPVLLGVLEEAVHLARHLLMAQLELLLGGIAHGESLDRDLLFELADGLALLVDFRLLLLLYLFQLC